MKQMRPFKNLDEAQSAIDSFEGTADEFELPISDDLNDPVGINMAILTDAILARGWEPNGFEPKDGYRIYRYNVLGS